MSVYYFNSIRSNQKGVSLVSVLVGLGLTGILSVVILNLMDFQLKLPTVAKSQNSETEFRQILRYMDNESCEKTFSGENIGASITQIKSFNKKDGSTTVVFDIGDQGSNESFEVVKIEVTPYIPPPPTPRPPSYTPTPTPTEGKATMTFYFKRRGTFIDQKSTVECSDSSTNSCFSDQCTLVLEDSNNPGTDGEPIGKCQPLSCGGVGSASPGNPDCYKITKDNESPPGQTLIGCGTTVENTVPYAVAYGFNAGSSSSTGPGNTFVGYGTGKVNTGGSNNVFLAHRAGTSNTGGSKNIFIGAGAGASNTVGSNNVFIGEGAGALNTGDSNQIFIKGGNSFMDIKDTSSIKMINGGEIDLSSSNIRVKYRTTEMTVTSGGLISWGSGSVSITADATFNSRMSTSEDCVQLANGSICKTDVDDLKDFVNRHGPSPEDHGSAFSPRVPLHPRECTNRCCPSSSCVACPPPPPPPSDRNLKEKINPLDEKRSLEQIANLKPVSFYWKDRGFPPGEHLGFIAQDVRTIFPQLVGENQHEDEGSFPGEGLLSLNYTGLIPVVVSALKSLIKTVERDTSQLKELLEKTKSNKKGLGSNNLRFSKIETELTRLSDEMKSMETESQFLKERVLEIKASTE